jgi:hypothetical protein
LASFARPVEVALVIALGVFAVTSSTSAGASPPEIPTSEVVVDVTPNPAPHGQVIQFEWAANGMNPPVSCHDNHTPSWIGTGPGNGSGVVYKTAGVDFTADFAWRVDCENEVVARYATELVDYQPPPPPPPVPPPPPPPPGEPPPPQNTEDPEEANVNSAHQLNFSNCGGSSPFYNPMVPCDAILCSGSGFGVYRRSAHNIFFAAFQDCTAWMAWQALTLCASRKRVRPTEGNWMTRSCTLRSQKIATYSVNAHQEIICQGVPPGTLYWWRWDVLGEGRAPWGQTNQTVGTGFMQANIACY